MPSFFVSIAFSFIALTFLFLGSAFWKPQLPSEEPVRLLVYAPAFAGVDEKSPSTLLAVTNNGWLLASLAAPPSLRR